MAFEFVNFPRQQLPFSRKTEKWRRQCVDWADSKTLFTTVPFPTPEGPAITNSFDFIIFPFYLFYQKNFIC